MACSVCKPALLARVTVAARRIRYLVCTIALALLSTAAAPGPAAWAQAAKGYVCNFTNGTVRTFENDTFTSKPAKPLSFEIGGIDLKNQFASLVTPKGTGDLRIVRAIGANHFLEVVTEGFLNITTIYETNTPSEPQPATHSRHFAFIGTPIFSQYEGLCTPK